MKFFEYLLFIKARYYDCDLIHMHPFRLRNILRILISPYQYKMPLIPLIAYHSECPLTSADGFTHRNSIYRRKELSRIV